MTSATLDIVPPGRIGMLLADSRTERGLSLADIARRSPFDTDALEMIEAGEVVLTEESLERILGAYGTTVEALLPPRRQVVLDLDEGRVLVAEETIDLRDGPSAEEVLSAYLSLVYTLRNATPGSSVVLRGFDVAVLAKALGLPEPEVESRLRDLMAEPTPEVGRMVRLFRSKLALPIAGAIVVATALGTVLVIRNDERPVPPPTGVSRTEVPDPELLPPLQQERNPDGSPGAPVEVTP